MALHPPAFETTELYGARLADTQFWAPYVSAALAHQGLSTEATTAGTAGTFPTFLCGPWVVKLFGELFAGGSSFEVEHSLHSLFLAHPEIPAPKLAASGSLFAEGWPWPYLITERLAGATWREVSLQTVDQNCIAQEVGAVARRVHALPPPSGDVWQRDLMPELYAGAVDRHRRWRTLPRRLIDQIADSLAELSSDRVLVHADLHADHLFVAGAHLTGIIDWGDALLDLRSSDVKRRATPNLSPAALLAPT